MLPSRANLTVQCQSVVSRSHVLKGPQVHHVPPTSPTTMRRLSRRSFSLLSLLGLLSQAMAMWPFPPERFSGNSLIDAGSLGLDPDGRVVALGDFNGDQL
jgi:hypothetical protein